VSEPNPGGGNRSGGPGSTYEPADESAASVFGEPARPRAPQARSPQGWPHPDRAPRPGQAPQPGQYPSGGRPPGYSPPATEVYPEAPGPGGDDPRQADHGHPGYGQPAYRQPGYGQGAYSQPGYGQAAYGAPPPSHAYAPPPTQAYAPAPPQAPPSGGRKPAGYDRARPSGGQAGAEQRRRPAGAGRDQGGGSSREGGSGLPVGLGALIGFAGLAAFLASLLVLPWFVDGGRDVTLADIRSAFTVAQTDPDVLLPEGPEASPPEATDSVPSPDQVGDAVEDQAREAAAQAAASAIDSGRSRYLELYTDTLWLVLAGAVTLATVFSTILSPRSFALSLILGFRRLSGAVTVLAGIVHGAAVWVVFTGTGAPSPATGVWIGVGGLVAVLVGCIVGPKK
jgi:hypothetical protein